MIAALLVLLSFLTFIVAFVYALASGDNLIPLVIAAVATAAAMAVTIAGGSRWP